MTREDIIRMAWSANLLQTEFSTAIQEMWISQLERFAHLIAAAEREECAKFLLSTDLFGLKNDPALQNFVANLLANYAAAIRARGQG